jgi:transcription elongation factor Elf1
MPKTHPCPKCNRQLTISGAVQMSDEILDVYQCDECVVNWQFDGATFEVAFTFAIDAQGRLIDPDSFEPLNLDDA